MDKSQFLKSIRSDNRSSPAGMHWENFRKHLVRSAKLEAKFKLPNPLILGGDIASHAEKHLRLSEQLDWAEAHDCLDDALAFLSSLPPAAWNVSSGADWHDEHPWARGEW
ncbi:hypothetical protein J7I44_13870 [Frateuria sp. MAH-13]|uniref:Uncharacterized protein n=1 Tax=Frateuria flava TaxID=2821489 RepID=A0ABS4DQT6_9GAMM|nr:hypothetical protein [Frateuria flava]MBP1475396.1 hypothetical protein [Frateuria flava]